MPIDVVLFNMVESGLARWARPLQMLPGAIRHPPHNLKDSDTESPMNQYLLRNVRGRKHWKANELIRLYRKSRWARLLLTGEAQNIKVPYRG